MKAKQVLLLSAKEKQVMDWLVADFPLRLPVVVIALCGEFAWGKNVTRYQWKRWADAINGDPRVEFLYACRLGHLPLVQWFPYIAELLLVTGFYEACERGHVHVVQWLMRRVSCNYWSSGLTGACENGHLRVVKLFLKDAIGMHHNGFRAACYMGHFNVVRWLVLNGETDDFYAGLYWARYVGHDEIVQWLERQK